MTAVILLLLALSGPPGTGQEETVPVFTRVSPDSGLSQNSIYDIVQDKRGFLWVATKEGLNRYDGYRFVSYRHDPRDPASLPDDQVQVVFEDRSGTLWVVTASGASRFDDRAGRFDRIRLSRRGSDTVTAAVWQILEDKAGLLWLATPMGIGRIDRTTLGARLYDEPQSVRHLHEDHTGAFWACQLSWTDCYRYDRAKDSFVSSPAPVSSRDSTPSNVMMQDSRGGVWLESDRIYRYQPSTGRIQTFELGDTGPSALSGIRKLYEDRSGTVWLGTLGGLYRWDPHARHFSQRTHQPDNSNSVSSNLVSAVAEDSEGSLWIGTIGGGLNVIDPTRHQITRYRHDPKNANTVSSDVVWSIHEDGHRALWIATDDGLNVLDRRTGRFRVARCPPGSPRRELPNSVSSIAPGATGELWLGLYGGQVARFDPVRFTCSLIDYGAFTPPMAEAGSTVVYPDGPGSLWIGVEGGGLQHYAAATGLTRYPLAGTGASGLGARTVWTIHRVANGSLWLGTESGLARFDPATASFTRVWERDLPSAVVYAIAEDSNHRLWLSTNSGICAFDPNAASGHQFEFFTSADGLGNMEFNRRAALRSRTGELFFGGMQGLTSFDPLQILKKNPVVPPIVVTDVEARNREGSRSINPTPVDRITLSYEDYTLTFGFVALSFTNPAKNRYAYKLEGFDPDWVGPSSRRIAQYTNVPPGSYTFRVKGSNNDGVWNEEGAALKILITPPFWQRWWFRTLAVTAIAGLLLAAHRYRLQHVLAIERIRRQVATDLHDDVGSALSQVAILSEVAKRDATPAAAALMTETANLARSMRESLSDIVWAVDPRRDRLTDLVYRMRQAAVNSLESDGVQVDFRAPADDDIERVALAPDRRRHLLLIFKEAITNIGRHARASRVSIDFSVRGRSVALTVSDNGRGFDTRSHSDGHGLQSMARRAHELGARLSLESTPAIGTTIRVEVPFG